MTNELFPPPHELVSPNFPVRVPIAHDGAVPGLQSHEHAPACTCGAVTTSDVVKFDGHDVARVGAYAIGAHGVGKLDVHTLASVVHGSGGPGSLTTSTIVTSF